MNKYVFAAVAASLAMSTTAFAGPQGSTSNGQTGRLTGNAPAEFDDNYFGSHTVCNETQHRKWDTVSCTLSTPTSLAGTSSTVPWLSDFDHTSVGTMTYTVSADGLSYSGKVTYP